MWVNVKRAETARGAFVGGQQMYVEYMIPAQVRHPFPVVLVHGGGGQGTDWMGTPDGRPGWFQYLVSGRLQGVRRRSPGTRAIAAASRAARRVPGAGAHAREHRRPIHAAERESRAARRTSTRRITTSGPGPGNVGSPDLDQLDAGHGRQLRRGSRRLPAVAAARPGGRRGRWWSRPGRRSRCRAGRSAAAGESAAGGRSSTCSTWRGVRPGADLLDKIGPAIIMTHSAGGPFGLLVAEARPNLVKATVIIEGAGGGAFGGGNRWGMSTIPVTYDPPVTDPAEIKTKWVANPEPGVAGYFLQEEPARKLPNLKNTKVLIVTADASFASPGNPGARRVPEAGGRAGRGAAAGASSASRATAT